MFNIEEFDIKLDTEFIGRNFVLCEELDSTNTVLLEGKEYKENGTVLMSELQTKGRGRKNRSWLSNKEQNLTFSIMLNDNIKENSINIINLGASLSVAQSIENLYQCKVELKWPNDVLIDKKKLCGILLESKSSGSKIDRVIVGIGINVNQTNFPGQYIIHPTSIKKELGSDVSRERLLSEVLNNFEEQFNISQTTPKKILEDWKSRCKMLGEKITVIEGDNNKYGIFEDIDENGFLILKRGDEKEVIHFGDVSVR